jgi:long-subunit fatty acid transport protein
MMIRKISLVAVAVALAAVFAFAQEGGKKSVKVTGYVIDNMCAGMHGTEDEAKKHPNSCALMASCEKSGFAVVSGDKTYKLDEQGNKLAADVLKGAKTKRGLKVDVEGTLDGDTLHAEKLTAATE